MRHHDVASTISTSFFDVPCVSLPLLRRTRYTNHLDPPTHKLTPNYDIIDKSLFISSSLSSTSSSPLRVLWTPTEYTCGKCLRHKCAWNEQIIIGVYLLRFVSKKVTFTKHAKILNLCVYYKWCKTLERSLAFVFGHFGSKILFILFQHSRLVWSV